MHESLTNLYSLSHKDVIKELYTESYIPIMNGDYRLGFLTNFLIFFQSFISHTKDNYVVSEKKIAFVFFKNEYEAAVRNKDVISNYSICRLQANKIHWRLNVNSFFDFLKLLFIFVICSYALFGFSFLNRFAYSIRGWFIYIYFYDFFKRSCIQEVFLFNLLNPSSLGIYLAALNNNLKVNFCEHAATPKIALTRKLFFTKYFLLHPHTLTLFSNYADKSSQFNIIYPNLVALNIGFKNVEFIGCCINSLDEISTINKILALLKLNNFNVCVRVHDADKRYHAIKRNVLACGFNFSSANDSAIDSFINSVDLVLAGNSNVIGDSIRLNKPVVYFWDGPKYLNDLYGIVEHYDVKAFNSMSQLEKFFTSLEKCR
jgi:hypothetical protein